MGLMHRTRGPHHEHHLEQHQFVTTKPLPEPSPDEVIVLVGAKQVPFHVNRRLLCEASPFFRQQLSPSPSTPRHSYKPISLWLPGESATMFALFVEWVHDRHTFRSYLDDAIVTAHEDCTQTLQDIHWAVIRLHLFAAHLNLDVLQDLAMDAIQDLYLKCDWDVPPGLIIYLYTKCESGPAVRLRRWAVAMVAFSLTVSWHVKFHPQGRETSDPARFRALFDSIPEFATDYSIHVRNMRASRLDLRFKNPQLRIPANSLHNEKRMFGFRECSFHSHRASVGEGPCPHSVDLRRGSEIGFDLDDIDTNEWDEEEEDGFGVYNGSDAEYVPMGLAPASKNSGEQATPRPLFSQRNESLPTVVGREGILTRGS